MYVDNEGRIMTKDNDVVVAGMGVITAIGDNISSFKESLKAGKSRFGYLEFQCNDSEKKYICSRIEGFSYQDRIKKEDETEITKFCKKLRNASYSSQLSLITALEAWKDAKLDDKEIDNKTSLIVAGSNFHQLETRQMQEKYRDKVNLIRPAYGLTFLDTDVVGVLSEAFKIRGEGYTLGGASASGNVGIIHGARQIKNQDADRVVVVGAMMHLSEFELQGLINLGAMGGASYFDQPDKACRPFDKKHEGFIYGEGCGCIILETRGSARKRGANIYGSIEGYGLCLDANRNPNPSMIGEATAMKKAVQMAGLNADQIDYINSHGTASVIGDETEIEAIKKTGLSNAVINATKSLTGHTLSAAGVIECIASLIQMNEGFYHPTCNLDNPIDADLNWVDNNLKIKKAEYALSNSFGFGGINSAIVIRSKNTIQGE